MRAVALSDNDVISALNKYTIPVWENVQGQRGVGKSCNHDTTSTSVDTYNGSGSHNVQAYFLAPDGAVLNTLPGYWQADAIVNEAMFSYQLYKLYKSNRSEVNKAKAYQIMHKNHTLKHGQAVKERAKLQGFDMKHEMKRANQSYFVKEYIDLYDKDNYYNVKHSYGTYFKPTDEVVHAYMAQYPFEPLDEFKPLRYGTKFYDSGNDGCIQEDRKVAKRIGEKYMDLKNRRTKIQTGKTNVAYSNDNKMKEVEDAVETLYNVFKAKKNKMKDKPDRNEIVSALETIINNKETIAEEFNVPTYKLNRAIQSLENLLERAREREEKGHTNAYLN